MNYQIIEQELKVAIQKEVQKAVFKDQIE